MRESEVLPASPHASSAADLIGEIYDAALAPELWPAVLAATAAYVGGQSAAVISKNLSGPGRLIHFDGLIDPQYAELYFRQYHRYDPATPAHLIAPVDRVLSSDDVIERDEFEATRIWLEWCRPQALIDAFAAVLEKGRTASTLLYVLRNERHGIADDHARQRMALLTPHVRRAVAIANSFNQHRAEAASFADALDGLAAAVFFVDSAGRVVHANRSGHDMLGTGAASLRQSGAVSLGREAGGQLAAVLADAGKTADAFDGRSVLIDAADGTRYVAHVLPLTSGARRQAGAPYDAVAALFVKRANSPLPSTPEVIAEAFELTPSELRVLFSIVEVGGVPDTAEHLGIAESTVKSHLHRIFGKTETTRQADLARLLATYASPLARRT